MVRTACVIAVAKARDTFEPYLHQCRFNDCLHENEPDCTIKKAVLKGDIAKSRYQSYLQVLALIREENRRMKR